MQNLILPLAGKTALVTGIANENSIAWGIAKELHAHGAHIVATIQNEKTARFTSELFESIDAQWMVCDLAMPQDLARLRDEVGAVDIVVHSVAYAPMQALKGRVLDVNVSDFQITMGVSVHTYVALVKALEDNLRVGASIMTVSYLGSERFVEGYGIMGVAKAALESTTRYLAYELGRLGVTVNTLSPGPIATRAASAITGFDTLQDEYRANCATGELATQKQVGQAAVALAVNRAITGQTIYIDGGFNVLGA